MVLDGNTAKEFLSAWTLMEPQIYPRAELKGSILGHIASTPKHILNEAFERLPLELRTDPDEHVLTCRRIN